MKNKLKKFFEVRGLLATTPSDLQMATANKSCGLLTAQFYTEALLQLQQTTHFGIHGSREPWRQTRTYRAISHSRVRQFSIVGLGIMLSSKIYSRKVSQRLVIENFVPRNYLAIR